MKRKNNFYRKIKWELEKSLNDCYFVVNMDFQMQMSNAKFKMKTAFPLLLRRLSSHPLKRTKKAGNPSAR